MKLCHSLSTLMVPMPQFEPFFPAHAIERCSATIIFDQSIPAKVFGQILGELTSALSAAGLVEGPPSIQFQIDIAEGRVDGPASQSINTFSTADRTSVLTLFPSQIVWGSRQYIRWAHFKSQMDTFLTPALSRATSVVSVSAVQLEYWDRFIWSGSWEDIDCAQLLGSSPLLAEEARQKPQQWHSHIGWFDDLGEGRRQLTNVNVDVLTAIPINSVTGKPSVGIYSQLAQQVLPPLPGSGDTRWIEDAEVGDILDKQHVSLKRLLKRLINSDMASRIGL